MDHKDSKMTMNQFCLVLSVKTVETMMKQQQVLYFNV